MKNYLLLLLPAILLCGTVKAQTEPAEKKKNKYAERLHLDDDETTRFALQAQGGYYMLGGGYGLESYRRFQQSYNTANASRLAKPLGGLAPTGAWYWGGGFHFIFRNMYYGFYITRYNMDVATQSVFKNGDKRELYITMKPIDLDFALLMGFGKRIKAGLSVGYEDQHAILYSGYRYSGDGRLSYGTDQALNGVYHGTSDFGMTMGIRADIAIVRQARLTLRADYVGIFSGKQKDGTSDYETDPWLDIMYDKSGSGGVHTDNDNHFFLPENVANANNSDVYFAGVGGCFAKLYRGMRFTLGLEVDLWAPRLN